ncbi:energy-coupling factor transporter transmembrane component T family protein [Paenibacillus naphthalenovorans]|uniref:energy-coupling factor transporter transmembrane component T family protein n=1 Tax=Paenibacillus naphthalenovorans TaxID=162209 RepID=UPI000882FE09|nr:energy-coupling factor transporter transmembrane component T [Paenibacillus naphthalenovorans]SDI08140.1 energy-coupling factor transport system permease protein [Paenibacillus naphthalenovorans]
MSWSYRETWLHRVNPAFKLIVSVGMFMVVLLTHHLNVLIHVTWMLALLFFAAAGHPVRRLLLLTLPFALMFVSSATSMVFFGKGETTWLRWGLIHITEESFYRGMHIGLKSVNMALIGLLFGLTTSPVRLFYSLMQQVRLPAKYAYSFMAAMRLLPMVASEYRTLQMALKVRGVKRAKGIRGWMESLNRYAIPLLAQSIRRAQRIAVAMEAKRFSSAKRRSYYYLIGWSARDGLLAGVMLLICLAAFWLGRDFPYFNIGDVRTG